VDYCSTIFLCMHNDFMDCVKVCPNCCLKKSNMIRGCREQSILNLCCLYSGLQFIVSINCMFVKSNDVIFSNNKKISVDSKFARLRTIEFMHV
jgi:hypothetical protein